MGEQEQANFSCIEGSLGEHNLGEGLKDFRIVRHCRQGFGRHFVSEETPCRDGSKGEERTSKRTNKKRKEDFGKGALQTQWGFFGSPRKRCWLRTGGGFKRGVKK